MAYERALTRSCAYDFKWRMVVNEHGPDFAASPLETTLEFCLSCTLFFLDRWYQWLEDMAVGPFIYLSPPYEVYFSRLADIIKGGKSRRGSLISNIAFKPPCPYPNLLFLCLEKKIVRTLPTTNLP